MLHLEVGVGQLRMNGSRENLLQPASNTVALFNIGQLPASSTSFSREYPWPANAFSFLTYAH